MLKSVWSMSRFLGAVLSMPILLFAQVAEALNANAEGSTDDSMCYFFSGGFITNERTVFLNRKYDEKVLQELRCAVLSFDAKSFNESVFWKAPSQVRNVKVSPDKRFIAISLLSTQEITPNPSLYVLDNNASVIRTVHPEQQTFAVMDFAWSPDSESITYVAGAPVSDQSVFDYAPHGVYIATVLNDSSRLIFPFGYEVCWSQESNAIYIYNITWCSPFVYRFCANSKTLYETSYRDINFSSDITRVRLKVE